MIYARLYNRESYLVFSEIDADAVGEWDRTKSRHQYFIWNDESSIYNFEIISDYDFDHDYDIVSVQGPTHIVERVMNIPDTVEDNVETEEPEPIHILKLNLKAIQGFVDADNEERIRHYASISELEHSISKNQQRVNDLTAAIKKLEEE